MEDHSKRPVNLSQQAKINNSIDLQDTETEGKPSIYLFIFVNPLSGDQKGRDLIDLPIQNFRLRRFPQIQVEIHNILDDQERELGIKNIKLVHTTASLGKLPPVIPPNPEESNPGKNKKKKKKKFYKNI
ncbi:hypothetical protein G6F56_006255 [Rhizopus delemar]|nr:hypothetical protein G6F56_006255 [Rhizopus delemar]